MEKLIHAKGSWAPRGAQKLPKRPQRAVPMTLPIGTSTGTPKNKGGRHHLGSLQYTIPVWRRPESRVPALSEPHLLGGLDDTLCTSSLSLDPMDVQICDVFVCPWVLRFARLPAHHSLPRMCFHDVDR